MTICPCCGAKFEGDLAEGCASCGARPVGPPLARPARELPGYGRAFASAGAGLVLAFASFAAFVGALLRREDFSLAPSSLLRAAETAAWELKWTALPLALVCACACARACRRIRLEPSRFTGLRLARAGAATTAAVGLLLAALVAVTVPERLRRREVARRAAENALLYASDQALARYRARFGSYPAHASDLKRLDDPTCELAAVVAQLEAGEYKPETDLASLSTGRGKSRGRRTTALVRARGARNADDSMDAGLALTNYELTLPGRDRLLGTEDDLRLRDGRIVAAVPTGGRSTNRGDRPSH